MSGGCSTCRMCSTCGSAVKQHRCDPVRSETGTWAWLRFRLILTGMASLLLLPCLGGCDSEPSDPEAQIRAVLEAGEREIETRDLSAVMARIDPAYSDTRRQDRRALRALLAGYFFRHPSIYLISQVDRVHVEAPDRASVVLLAGMAGSARESDVSLEGWRGNLLRFDLVFQRHEGEEWRLISADWRAARREDLVR